MVIINFFASIFRSTATQKAMELSIKIYDLFSDFQSKDQNAKNAAIDTLISLLNDHKSIIDTVKAKV